MNRGRSEWLMECWIWWRNYWFNARSENLGLNVYVSINCIWIVTLTSIMKIDALHMPDDTQCWDWTQVNSFWPSIKRCSCNIYDNNNNNNLVWWHCHRVALYKMWYKLKSACSVLSMLNQIDVFLSALQMYLNQKRKTSNQQAKHSNCWGQPPQKISNPSQSDDWVQQCHHEQQISKPIDQAPKKY